MNTGRLPNHKSQRGAVLIVALVLLLVLTVLGTAGIRDTAMEERMAGNFRDYSAALAAAEAALRAGELSVESTSAFQAMLFDGSDGTYDVTPASHSVDPNTAGNWNAVNAAVMDSANTKISQDPDFYIERLPEIALPGSDLVVGFQDQAPRVQYYRVTGKGYGISPNAEVILQSTYFR